MVSFGHTAMGVGVGIISFHFLQPSVGSLAGLFEAGALGVVSHYFTDFIPHGHFFKEGKNLKRNLTLVIIFDLFLSILLFSFLIYKRFGINYESLYILFALGGAQLPDVVDGLLRVGALPLKGFLKVENSFHQAIHWHGSGKNGLLLGLRDVWQLATIVLSVFLLRRI